MISGDVAARRVRDGANSLSHASTLVLEINEIASPNDQAGVTSGVNLISISLALKVINFEHGKSQSNLLNERTRCAFIIESNLLKSLVLYTCILCRKHRVSKCNFYSLTSFLFKDISHNFVSYQNYRI